MTTAQTNPANLAPAPAPAPTQPRGEMVALDKPAPNAKSILDVMQRMADRLASVATKHLTPEKLIRMIGVQMQRVPKLGNCTPISVLDCAMTCAELGIAPGILGDAYLIPYGTTCTVIVGYRGLLKLARRSGQISTIQAEVVREGDEFHWRLGVDATLEHIPTAEAEAKMTHAWALAKFKDGSVQFVVMRAPEVNAIRGRSKAAQSGPWVTDTAEMWKKTALRRLCKMLPLTAEIEQAIEIADRTEFKVEDFNMLPARPEPTSAGDIATEVQKQLNDIEKSAGNGEQPAQDTPDPITDQPLEPEPPEVARRREELANLGEKVKQNESLPGMSDAPTNRPPKRGR